MRTILMAWLGSLTAATGDGLPAPAPSASPVADSWNYALGTQSFGASYQFTTEPLLVETAQAILEMGSNVLKFGMGSNYAKAKGGNVREACPEVQCLRDLAAREPAHRRVLDMPFAYYLIWAYPFAEGWWKNGYPEDVSRRQSREVYDLVCHLLQTYSGTDKAFFIGHWEGDWHLRDGYDTTTDDTITPERVQGMVDWLNARQAAVDAAKRDTPHARVQVWNYAEVNLVRLAVAGRRTVTNDVLPKTNVDFVSYSCYDTQAQADALTAALSYVESKLVPKPGIPGRRVFIGEYGFPAASHTPEQQDLCSQQVQRTALAWGCPFALYWEMYNNEVDQDGRQRGFWLIDDKGVRQPVYETHRRFYQWARTYRSEAEKRSGRQPTFDEFRQAAVGWLDQRPPTVSSTERQPATGGPIMARKSAPFDGSWELVTKAAAFSPRDTSEGVVFQGKLWLSNAYHAGNVLVRDLWNSADGAVWTKVLEPTPYDGYSEMVVYQDRLWAIKGSVWGSEDGVAWKQVLEKTPFGARSYGECVVFAGRLWQLGSGPGVWWTTDGANWTCALAEAPYGPRSACAVGVYKDRLWVMGGWISTPSDPPEKHYKAATSLNDVWSSPDGVNWTRVCEHAPWSERLWFVSETFADRLWVLGGFSNRESRNFAECWYTEDGAEWQRFAPEPHWSARHEPTTYLFQEKLWLVAGNAWPLMNDVWRLIPADRDGVSPIR